MGKSFLALYGGVYLFGHLEQQLRWWFYPEKYTSFPEEFTFTFVPALVGGPLLVVTALPVGLNHFAPDGVLEIIRFYYSLYGGYYLLLHLGLFFNFPVKDLVVQLDSFFFGINGVTLAGWTIFPRAGRTTLATTALGTGGIYLYQINETRRVKMETEVQLKEIDYKNRLLEYKMEEAKPLTWSEYLMGRSVKNSIVPLEDLCWLVKFLPFGEYLSFPEGLLFLGVALGFRVLIIKKFK